MADQTLFGSVESVNDTAKTCQTCRRTLPLSAFHKLAKSKDGHQSRCKECVRTYMKARYESKRETLLEEKKEYYLANREHLKAKQRAWHHNNREVAAQKSRAYYAANRDERREKMREYMSRPEVQKRMAEHRGEYYDANRETFIKKGKEYRRSERGREVLAKAHAKEKTRHAHKIRARYIVSNALARGKITRPARCERCGTACKPEAHHHKGYEPEHALDVQWLCVDCHKLLDCPRRRAPST